jgi:hypothetical protein
MYPGGINSQKKTLTDRNPVRTSIEPILCRKYDTVGQQDTDGNAELVPRDKCAADLNELTQQ